MAEFTSEISGHILRSDQSTILWKRPAGHLRKALYRLDGLPFIEFQITDIFNCIIWPFPFTNPFKWYASLFQIMDIFGYAALPLFFTNTYEYSIYSNMHPSYKCDTKVRSLFVGHIKKWQKFFSAVSFEYSIYAQKNCVFLCTKAIQKRTLCLYVVEEAV